MSKIKSTEAYDVLEVSRHVINYSNRQKYGISNLKLQKILYFIQAYFLMEKDAPCFKERIEAWNFGPVVPESYCEYKQYGSGDIPTVKAYRVYNGKNLWDFEWVKFNDDVISDSDKELIDAVVDNFADYYATDLVALTHEQTPWKAAYVPYQNNEITLKALKDFFDADE